MNLPNRTKIVATLGPASESEEVITQLVQAGADVFRLNCSHSDHKGLVDKMNTVRRVAAKLEAPVGLLADLQGPKSASARSRTQSPSGSSRANP